MTPFGKIEDFHEFLEKGPSQRPTSLQIVSEGATRLTPDV